MSVMEKDTVNIRRMGRGDIDAILAIDRKISGGGGSLPIEIWSPLTREEHLT
jgi:hypothetical protein